MNWMNATETERQQLFNVASTLIWEHDMSWDDLYLLAFGEKPIISIDYENNFRRGKISRKKAYLIYKWLAENHPEYYSILNDKLGLNQARPLSGRVVIPQSWNRLVSDCQPDGTIEVRLLNERCNEPEPSHPNTTHEERNETSDRSDADTLIAQAMRVDKVSSVAPTIKGLRIALGEEFYFRLNKGFEGRILGLYLIGEHWRPVSFSSHRLSASLSGKPESLPCNPATGEPTGLIEDQHFGKHSFVFILANDDVITALENDLRPAAVISDHQLEALATSIENSDLPISRLAVEIMVLPYPVTITPSAEIPSFLRRNSISSR